MKFSRILLAGAASAVLAACSTNGGGNPLAGWFGIPKEGQQTAQGSETGTQTQVSAASPQLVRDVQQQLRAKGIEGGPVDGVWGDRTQQAVRQFQQQRNLEPTGQLDVRTLAALGVFQETADGGAGTQQPTADGGSPPRSDGGSASSRQSGGASGPESTSQ